MRYTILIVLTLGWSTLAASAEILQKPASIKSPVDWALGYFLVSHGEGTHIARTRLDLDHDGIDELFLGWLAARGRNGMPFLVFRKADAGYEFMGELFARQDLSGLKVLPLTENNQIRFAQFWAHGGCDGTIAISTHDGTRFSVVESEKICAGDAGTEQGNQRYREIFGD